MLTSFSCGHEVSFKWINKLWFLQIIGCLQEIIEFLGFQQYISIDFVQRKPNCTLYKRMVLVIVYKVLPATSLIEIDLQLKVLLYRIIYLYILFVTNWSFQTTCSVMYETKLLVISIPLYNKIIILYFFLLCFFTFSCWKSNGNMFTLRVSFNNQIHQSPSFFVNF